MKTLSAFFCATLLLVLSSARVLAAQPLQFDFTYQGVLKSQGQPATGTYDFRFDLYTNDTFGASFAAVTNSSVTVSNGLFTAPVDFGPNTFNGDESWLGVQVRTNGAAVFTLLAATLESLQHRETAFASSRQAKSR